MKIVVSSTNLAKIVKQTAGISLTIALDLEKGHISFDGYGDPFPVVLPFECRQKHGVKDITDLYQVRVGVQRNNTSNLPFARQENKFHGGMVKDI